ncbi:MAG: alpha/beta hydrolase [Candidatus Aenigmarchaeota archaeon]|nr:alpha/beta hydrolase [Candidatus Aenigmarchaeota archaeon]
MKNAVILHGSSCTPNSYWLPSIKKFLEKQGYSVWVPQLPNPEAPDLKIQLPFVLKNATFNNETIIIGHSSGCPLILSVLESIDVKINKAILVAGYARKPEKMYEPSLKKEEQDAEPILQAKYNWEKIKQNAGELYFINSDNDPWGCDDDEGEYMFRNLGGTLIIRHGEGHI